MRARPLLVSAVASTLAAALLLPAQAAITPTAPVTISGPGSVGSPQVQVDSSGRAVAIWSEVGESGLAQLWSAERPAGGTWSVPTAITTGSSGVTGLDFDVNEAGDAAVVFRRFDAVRSEHVLWGSYRAAASPAWSDPSAFGGLVHGVDTSGDFGVAVMSDGTAVSAYVAPDGTPGLPDTTRRAYAGTGGTGGWSGEVHISDTGHIAVVGDQEQRDVSSIAIAADGAGAARVLMRMEAHSESTFGTRYRLMRTSRTTSTGWTAITPITSIDASYPQPENPRVAGDPAAAGGFVEAWTENSSGDAVVRVNKGGDVRTFADPSQAPDQISKHMLIADLAVRAGVAAVNTYYSEAVEEGQDSVTRVGTSVWRSGSGWSDLMDPVEDPQYGAFRPDLTIHSDGAVSQTYDQGFGSLANIYVTQLPPGSSTWSGERLISRYTTDGRSDTAAALEAGIADEAVIVWRRNHGGTPNRYTVEAASFTGSATPSPTPTSPTTTTSSPSPSPTVTAPAPVPPASSVPAAPAPLPSAFVAVVEPKVKGKPIVGTTLKARPGTWQPAPAKVTYQWRAGSKAIKKATRPRLKLTSALRGKKISVRITLAAPGVSTRTVTVKVKGKVKG
ncbi:hypothetical protein [Nocardioides piscis]|uniref:Uncharacterized protein n=1 Tax=Nocardioides piscis TaxID=2714938 RepID=A0A6G7YDK8_9ACTN|nr:hypothetical protein [Nocardioides piscis]QIK74860.1 hypothetical protein G7071_04870 [Nocardioides piscis]